MKCCEHMKLSVEWLGMSFDCDQKWSKWATETPSIFTSRILPVIHDVQTDDVVPKSFPKKIHRLLAILFKWPADIIQKKAKKKRVIKVCGQTSRWPLDAGKHGRKGVFLGDLVKIFLSQMGQTNNGKNHHWFEEHPDCNLCIFLVIFQFCHVCWQVNVNVGGDQWSNTYGMLSFKNSKVGQFIMIDNNGNSGGVNVFNNECSTLHPGNTDTVIINRQNV